MGGEAARDGWVEPTEAMERRAMAGEATALVEQVPAAEEEEVVAAAAVAALDTEEAVAKAQEKGVEVSEAEVRLEAMKVASVVIELGPVEVARAPEDRAKVAVAVAVAADLAQAVVEGMVLVMVVDKLAAVAWPVGQAGGVPEAAQVEKVVVEKALVVGVTGEVVPVAVATMEMVVAAATALEMVVGQMGWEGPTVVAVV